MRAVVVTNVGSIPEAVDHGKTGIIVPPKDVTALADAIVALLVNRDLRKDMGVNGLKKLEKDLSPERIADLTMDLYIGSIVDWRH
jgi:glycosyltransferase involved in cell wall biosynthesis